MPSRKRWPMPEVSIVVPWRGGDRCREASLAFVSVWLRRVFPDASFELADDGGDPFARGASIDQAVADAPGSVIVVCDADILVPAAQLRQAVQFATSSPGQVIPFGLYRYLTGPASEALRAGPVDDTAWHVFEHEWTYAVAVGAAAVFTRETHEQSGGHPGFRGWGCEDVGFFLACETLVAPMRRVPGDCLHLWHPTAEPGDYRTDQQVKVNAGLLARYSEACGDPEAMRALVTELHGSHDNPADV